MLSLFKVNPRRIYFVRVYNFFFNVTSSIMLQTGGVDSTALDRIVFNTRAWHGSATIPGHSGPLYAAMGYQPNSPDSSVHGNSTFSSSIFRGGGLGQTPHNRSQGKIGGIGLYRHTIHPSVGNVSMYNGRLSADFSSAAAEAASPSLSSGGGSARQLWSARSDPAIAATGLKADSYADISEPLPAMRSFTFLRLGPEILQTSYQTPWMKFMWKMREAGYY